MTSPSSRQRRPGAGVCTQAITSSSVPAFYYHYYEWTKIAFLSSIMGAISEDIITKTLWYIVGIITIGAALYHCHEMKQK